MCSFLAAESFVPQFGSQAIDVAIETDDDLSLAKSVIVSDDAQLGAGHLFDVFLQDPSGIVVLYRGAACDDDVV